MTMSEELCFKTRRDFRSWLDRNSKTSSGIWIVFEKGLSLSANEALEEALCFGWIDGVMKKIDSSKYKKYFAKRTKNSKWSEKNKKLAIDLEKKNLITQQGLEAIENAKHNGMWATVQKNEFNDEMITNFSELLKENEMAFKNYSNMSFSVKKTYVLFYRDAKSEEVKKSRLEKIIHRLEQNLKPM
jgi:uncharacterized protein YdeI (YjbR/CyaY-like superfamily)